MTDALQIGLIVTSFTLAGQGLLSLGREAYNRYFSKKDKNDNILRADIIEIKNWTNDVNITLKGMSSDLIAVNQKLLSITDRHKFIDTQLSIISRCVHNVKEALGVIADDHENQHHKNLQRVRDIIVNIDNQLEK